MSDLPSSPTSPVPSESDLSTPPSTPPHSSPLPMEKLVDQDALVTTIQEETDSPKDAEVPKAEDPEAEEEKPKKRGRKPKAIDPNAPIPTPKKRGRKPKAVDPDGPAPKKRGRKPNAAAKDGEEEEPATKKLKGQDDDNDGDADDETPVVPKTPSVPKNRAGAGTSTALTKDEARYIFQTMVDNTKWPEVVKETNKKAPEGVERIVSNVKAHWVKFVGERVIGFYKN